MNSSLWFTFSILSAITLALAYHSILQKLSLRLVSPYPKADIAKRVFAATIDLILVATAISYSRIFESIGYLVVAIFYLLFRDAIGGRSVGKFVFGLVVTDLRTGRPCGYGAGIRRNILFLWPGANVVAAFLEASTLLRDPQGQRLGDRFALTQVVEGFGLKDLVAGVLQWFLDLVEQAAEQFGARVRRPGRVPVKSGLAEPFSRRNRKSRLSVIEIVSTSSAEEMKAVREERQEVMKE